MPRPIEIIIICMYSTTRVQHEYNMSQDIFISYGREPDVILFVKQLKKDLEINGFAVWLDTDDIELGTDWRAEITTGVDTCR